MVTRGLAGPRSQPAKPSVPERVKSRLVRGIVEVQVNVGRPEIPIGDQIPVILAVSEVQPRLSIERNLAEQSGDICSAKSYDWLPVCNPLTNNS